MGSPENTIEAVYPLSPAQEGILFHTTVSTDRGIYTVQQLCTLQADLDIAQFKAAWQQVIQRHTVLRTAFLFEDAEKPLQVVGRQVQLPWEEDDWRAIPLDAERAQLDALLAVDRVRGFELTRAPLMRLRLIHRQDGSYYLLWSFHHAILDGWSLPLVLREVYAIYDAARRGQKAQLAVAQPYQSYIAWLRRQDLQRAERFWRTYLQGIAAPTSLGDPQGTTQEADYARCQIQLPDSLLDKLEALLQQQHLTVNTVLLGAWALLLSRYSGSADVIFGTAVSGRTAAVPGIDAMVGMFLNTLPVRVHVEERQPLLPWLQKIQQEQVELRQYEYSPLVQVQKWSDVPQGTPLFQNILICGTARTPHQGATISPEIGDVHARESTNYPLALNVEAGQPFLIQATYDAHLFAEAMIQRILTHLQMILRQMSESPEQRLRDIDLLSEAERRQLLIKWNMTGQVYAEEPCIHQCFAVQASKSPNAAAVVYEGRALSYQELDRKTNQLASYLRKRGVGPEVLVAICVERSLEMLIGILGILKAGGAYVPLDPQYPADRVAFILTDAACPLILTQEALLTQLSLAETQAICLDRDWQVIEEEDTAPLDELACADNLAYVIYTSGSTGKPKGVQIVHRAVHNFLQAMRQQIAIDSTDVWLAITTIAFDIAALELYLPLMVGARVIIASHEAVADGYQLAQLLSSVDATVLQATPATWRMLLSSGWSGKSDLKALCGGEALTSDLAQQLLSMCKTLWNMYGPTETTIWSTSSQIIEANAITLGHPIANTQTYVLDAALRPVPLGVEGQLYLGGLGLARGYMKRPELTAERFIPDPFGQDPGSRLYLTGDRVRYRADGCLEYLGRVDFQVKIRGFRIELGEIETVLRQHPLIREAVVVAQESVATHKRLVAYIVVASGEQGAVTPSASQVQDFLRQQLPDYMVPSLILSLEALPLTPNGKVDRRALPDPAGLLQPQPDSYAEPRSKIERQLAQIWQQALHVERVGIHDSFFSLGGDSILSVRVVAQARQAGMHLTVRDLFKHQTIAELGRSLGQTSPGSGTLMESQQVSEVVPLTPLQCWFFERRLPVANHWNQSFLFCTREPLDPALLRSSLRLLLETHDALRLRFYQEGDEWKQACVALEYEHELPLSIFSRSKAAQEEPETWIQERVAHLQASLSLDKGPLLRVALFDVGQDQPQYLLFVVHHLVVDITSWHILLSDWQQIYRQLQGDVPVRLSPVPTSFLFWATRLEAYAHSLRLMRERTYWFGRPWDQVKPIPLDMAHGENTEKHTRLLSIALNEQETHALLHEVSRAYHMLVHEVLLAALAEMHARWTQSRTLLVDLEGHGREDIIEGCDLSRTVGWFTTLVPLCLDIRQQKKTEEVLTQVKEQIRAVPHGGIGYGLLRYKSQSQEVRQHLADLPQSEIVFNYRGRSASVLDKDALLVPADDVSGSALHPDSPRSHLLAFEGQVTDGNLRITVAYSEQCYLSTTIEQLLEWYREALRTMIAHCQNQQEEHFTPQDFPEADLDQSELDTILASVYQEMES